MHVAYTIELLQVLTWVDVVVPDSPLTSTFVYEKAVYDDDEDDGGNTGNDDEEDEDGMHFCRGFFFGDCVECGVWVWVCVGGGCQISFIVGHLKHGGEKGLLYSCLNRRCLTSFFAPYGPVSKPPKSKIPWCPLFL